MSQKIFLIAGEHSGDVLGAGLLKALKEHGGCEFSGVGGPLMEREGLKSLLPMDELCVMGLWEVIWQLPRLLRLIEATVLEIEKYDPDIVVTIDLPDFNFQVAQRLKKRGKSKARIVHYVAPTVWAWRPGRAKKVAQFLDGLICLFPQEPAYFTKHKLKAEFVGHPLIEFDPSQAKGDAFRKQVGITSDVPVLGLFLGSREAEIDKHATIFNQAIGLVRLEYPNLHVLLPTLPQMEYKIKKIIEKVDYPAFVLVNPDEKWDEFAACNFALAVSGTVGLELAYMGIPHVIAYKMHPVSWVAVKAMVKTKYAHLANILLNEPVVPEFLQGKCDAMEIARGLLILIKDENVRQKQKSKAGQLRAMLTGEAGKTPSQKAAQFVLQIGKEPAKKLPKKPAKPKKKVAA